MGSKHHNKLLLKQWREYRGLTQDAFAERVGVTKATVSKIENGYYSPTVYQLETFGQALDCTALDLLLRLPNDPEEIWSVWERLSSGARRHLVSIAATFDKKP